MRRALLLGIGLALGATSASAEAEVVSYETYRDRLSGLRVRLAKGDLASARAMATALLEVRMEAAGGRLAPDGTLLLPILSAESAVSLRILERRIEWTLAATPARSGSDALADHQLLERLEARAGGTARRGGRVGLGPVRPLRVSERIGRVASAVAAALERAWRAAAELFRRFWPRSTTREGAEGAGPLALGVVALAAALLVVLAYRVLSRSRDRWVEPAPANSTPSSRRDEDPTSREAGEWERHAAELARLGRYRESTRAWYHAILVTLFGLGRLHYQKGRTNWEYLARLRPTEPWRASLLELTREFDHAWYGHAATSRQVFTGFAVRSRALIGELRAAGGRS